MGEEVIKILEILDDTGLFHEETPGCDDIGMYCRVNDGVMGQYKVFRPPDRQGVKAPV